MKKTQINQNGEKEEATDDFEGGQEQQKNERADTITGERPNTCKAIEIQTALAAKKDKPHARTNQVVLPSYTRSGKEKIRKELSERDKLSTLSNRKEERIEFRLVWVPPISKPTEEY